MKNKLLFSILGAAVIYFGYVVKSNFDLYLKYDPELRQSYTSTIEKAIEFQSRICLSTQPIKENIHEKELEQVVYDCVYSDYNLLSSIIPDFSKWKVTRGLISEYAEKYQAIPKKIPPNIEFPDSYLLDIA